MYTGRVERVCCLCGDRRTRTHIAVPPRAVTLMENGDPIAWRDIDGAVGLYFCDSDWAVVRDLVLDAGMHPLGRCNAAHAELSLGRPRGLSQRRQRAHRPGGHRGRPPRGGGGDTGCGG